MKMRRLKDDELFVKTLKSCDLTFYLCIVLFLLVHGCTMAIFSHIHTETKAEIEQITTVYEGNPVAKMVIDLSKIQFVIQFLIIPGIAYATYLHFKRRVLEEKMGIESLVYFLNFTVFALLSNFVNDASILLGKLL